MTVPYLAFESSVLPLVELVASDTKLPGDFTSWPVGTLHHAQGFKLKGFGIGFIGLAFDGHGTLLGEMLVSD